MILLIKTLSAIYKKTKNNLFTLFIKSIGLLLAIIILINSDLHSQNVITPSVWNNAANWDGKGIADTITEDVELNGNNKGEVTVPNGYSVTVGNVDLKQGNTFTISSGGTMNIGASGAGNERDLITDNNSVINVDGDLTVWGDLVVKNNLVLNVSGTLIIKGELSLNNGADIDISGSVTIDGDLTAGKNTIVNVEGSLEVGVDIVVGNNSELTGRGTVSLGGDCTDGGSDFCSSGPLPVELLEFTATANENAIRLSWSTASELNNDYFTLEKSRNGRDFEEIAHIDGSDTKSEVSNYEFTDHNPLIGLSYYRLSQTDFDGTTEFFPTTSILYNGKNNQFSISPNPISNQEMRLQTSGKEKNEELALYIVDLNGQPVYQKKLRADLFGNVDLEIQFNQYLKKGIYILKLESNSRKEHSKIFVE